jgi:hypothetical protein
MHVNPRRVAFAGVAMSAAIVLGLAASAVSAGAGSAPAATHILKFTAVNDFRSVPLKSGAYFAEGIDVRNGATIGRNVNSCVFGTTAVTCHLALALADDQGIIDAQFTANGHGAASGTVTGGTGAYAGASGTLTGTPGSVGEDVTITYTG